MPTIQGLITAFALSLPVEYHSKLVFPGMAFVRVRTVIFRNSYSVRLSSWQSGHQVLEGGQFGKVHWMFRIW